MCNISTITSKIATLRAEKNFLRDVDSWPKPLDK
jgi:hypothetical protein